MRLVLLAAALTIGVGLASAEEAEASWRRFINHQATVDLIGHGIYTDVQNELGGEFIAGLDAYGKVSNWNRDLATVVVQIYLGRSENHPLGVPAYDSANDWQLFPKITAINFHLSRDRRFNVKFGHFELPYGLEASINSNGTLRQFSHRSNLGLKLDWGATINGTFPKFQYEVGISRGSGMEIHSAQDPYAIAGRIGTPIDTENFWGTPSVGISFYQADFRLPTGSLQDRWRVGLDGQRYYGPLGLLGEVSVGETDSEETVNLLAEINATNRRETVLVYHQFRWIHQRRALGWDDFGSSALGIRYAPDTHWALSAQFTQELWQLARRQTDQIFSLQLRYRF